MRRRHVVHRRAFVALSLVMLAAATVTACAKGREQATTLPGALVKPLDQYTADEFYAFAHRLPFGGGVDKPRRCKNDPACDPKVGKLTSARVDAVDGQDSLSASALPANGVVAVMAKNTGQYEEDRYSMLPGDYEYYIVVRPAGDSATWSMQQVGTAPGKRTLAQVGSGTFHPCGHDFKHLKIRANFYTCDGSHQPNDSTVKMRLLLQDAFSDPIWTSCAMGCCTFT